MRRRSWWAFLVLVLVILLVSSCGPGATEAPPFDTPIGDALETKVESSGLQLTSEAFAAGATIPRTYTCDGEDISPPLSWSNPPVETESFALLMDDPDAPAGTWVHWVLFNIPPDQRSLAEEIPDEDELADGGRHGANSWERRDYGGPCPPSGSTHQYVFKLYALDTMLELEPGAPKGELLNAMEGHTLAQAELTAEYGRE